MIKTEKVALALLLMCSMLFCSCGAKTDKGEGGDAEEQVQAEVYRLEGKINGKYPVHMILDMGSLAGAYYYDKSGVDNYLTLKIHSYNEASGQMTIDEFNNKGELTGEFSGTLTDEGFSGNAKFGKKTMPFDLAICRDASAQFPQIAASDNASVAIAVAEANTANYNDSETPYDPKWGKTMVITVHMERSSATDLYIDHYVIKVAPNGIYNLKHESKYGTRNTSVEEFDITPAYNDEYSGSWEIYDAIKVGGEYKDFLCMKRSGSSDIWLSPDKTLIWWGEDSYYDADSYNIANAAKVTSISYE